MQQYAYQACDVEGKVHKGQLGAENEQEVVALLQNQQLIPLKIELVNDSGGNLFGRSGVNNSDLIDFTDGLCTLVQAYVPIDKALGLLQGLTAKPTVQELIADLRRDVKEGKSLADALDAHPQVFSRMYVNMVHAGEEGGILDQLLPKLAHFLSSANEARRTVISALIYPMILLIVGVVSVVLLMVLVVPQFATLFADMGSSIPPSAAFLLGLSKWLQSYGWTLLLIPPLLWLAWRQLGSTPELREQRDQFILSLPIFGQLMLEAESSRFCRTLGALLSAGIPLLKGLHIARGVMQNQVLSNSLARIEETVRGGTSLGKALSNEGIFPVLLSQLALVGEESGRTPAILEKLADTFDGNVKQKTARLVALVEPLMIVVLGGLVGAVVIIMLSAIFSINQINY